jgi:TfoX/Sxy family transcriptional regulator of competence genes
MAYDEGLAQRIREALDEPPGFVEKKMFGGIGFMLQGNLACGVIGDELIVRVGPDRYEHALAKPHTRPFDFTGRPMTGWITLAPGGYESDNDLRRWVEQGINFAKSLPPK